MTVYFIQAGDGGPVKIGVTDNVAIRLVKMQSDNAAQLRILRLFRGGADEEAALHTRFSDLHLRGEWYSFSRAMLGDIGLVDLPLERPKVIAEPEPEPIRADPQCQYPDISWVIRRCGGPTKAANAVGLSHSSVLGWTTVPPRHAATIALLAKIPLHVLRPDLWPANAGTPTPNLSPLGKYSDGAP